jgi:polyisoprenoid-binding protein YceI
LISFHLHRAAIAGALMVGLGVCGVAHAADQPYKVDTPHTQVLFAVSHMGFSITHGTFKKVDVSIKFDPKKPDKTSVDATVDVSSIDTGFGPRDEHLKTKDFFDVAQFPTMTFHSTKVEVTGADTAKLTGDLSLHGVTKPVTLDVKLNATGPAMMAPGASVYGFNLSGTIKRSDFGMTTFVPAPGTTAGVGDEITIAISSEVNNAPPMGPPPAKKN